MPIKDFFSSTHQMGVYCPQDMQEKNTPWHRCGKVKIWMSVIMNDSSTVVYRQLCFTPNSKDFGENVEFVRIDVWCLFLVAEVWRIHDSHQIELSSRKPKKLLECRKTTTVWNTVRTNALETSQMGSLVSFSTFLIFVKLTISHCQEKHCHCAARQALPVRVGDV